VACGSFVARIADGGQQVSTGSIERRVEAIVLNQRLEKSGGCAPA